MQVLRFQKPDFPMKKWCINSALVLVFVTSLSAHYSSSALAQGFGTRRTKMILYPKQAPRVFPVATNFAVKISTSALLRSDHLRQIKEGLEKSLPNYDRRFKLVVTRPE